jgi:hypothetical protein
MIWGKYIFSVQLFIWEVKNLAQTHIKIWVGLRQKRGDEKSI